MCSESAAGSHSQRRSRCNPPLPAEAEESMLFFLPFFFGPLTSGASWSSCSTLMLVGEPSLDDSEAQKGCLLILLILLFNTEGHAAPVIQRWHSPARDHGHQQPPPPPHQPPPLLIPVVGANPPCTPTLPPGRNTRVCCSHPSDTEAAVDVVTVPLEWW